MLLKQISAFSKITEYEVHIKNQLYILRDNFNKIYVRSIY